MYTEHEIIIENLRRGIPGTVRVYRATSYLDAHGHEQWHFDVCTAHKMHDDGSIDCQLGHYQASRWDPHVFGNGYSNFD